MWRRVAIEAQRTKIGWEKYLRLVTIGIGVALTSCGDSEKEANQLFVETSAQISAAWVDPDPVNKYKRLTEAQKSLEKIVTDFPASNVAVRIAANEKVGPVTKIELAGAIETLRSTPAICELAPSFECVSRVAYGLTHSEGTGARRAETILDAVSVAWLSGDNEALQGELLALDDIIRNGNGGTLSTKAFSLLLYQKFKENPDDFCREINDKLSGRIGTSSPLEGGRIFNDLIIRLLYRELRTRQLEILDVDALFRAFSSCRNLYSEAFGSGAPSLFSEMLPEAFSRAIERWPQEFLGKVVSGSSVSVWSEAQANIYVQRMPADRLHAISTFVPASISVIEQAIDRSDDVKAAQLLNLWYIDRAGTNISAEELISRAGKIAPGYRYRVFAGGMWARLRSDPAAAKKIISAWRSIAGDGASKNIDIYDHLVTRRLVETWPLLLRLAEAGDYSFYADFPVMSLLYLVNEDRSVKLRNLIDLQLLWADRSDKSLRGAVSNAFRAMNAQLRYDYEHGEKYLNKSDFVYFISALSTRSILDDQEMIEMSSYLTNKNFPELANAFRQRIAGKRDLVFQLDVKNALAAEDFDNLIKVIRNYPYEDRAEIVADEINRINDKNKKRLRDTLRALHSRVGEDAPSLLHLDNLCDSIEIVEECFEIVKNSRDEKAYYAGASVYLSKLAQDGSAKALGLIAFSNSPGSAKLRAAAAVALMNLLAPKKSLPPATPTIYPSRSEETTALKPVLTPEVSTERQELAPAPPSSVSVAQPRPSIAAPTNSVLPSPSSSESALKCASALKQKFPAPSSAMTSRTCACVDGRIKDGSGVPVATWNAAITGCGTDALSRLSEEENAFLKLRVEMLEECKKNPKGFGVPSAGDAIALCNCFMDNIVQKNRAALTIYAHLGQKSQLDKPMEQAVAACIPTEKLNAVPFQGKWAPVNKSCSAEQDEAELIAFEQDRLAMYETSCKLTDIRRKGEEITFKEHCEDSGGKWSTERKVLFKQGGKLFIGTKNQWTQYRRCSARP